MTDVEQIEEVLRSDVAEPSPAFAAELDELVREGFPRPSRRRLSLPRLWPALAGAAVFAVVAAVAIAVLGDNGQRPASTSEALEPPAAPRVANAARPAIAADSQLSLSVASGRRVERDVQLTIAAA